MPDGNLEQSSDAYAKISVPKGSQIITGEPANYPTALAAAIKQCAQSDNSINALWLREKLTIRSGDTFPSDRSLLLTVDLDGDLATTFERIANTIKPYIPSDMPLDLEPYDALREQPGTPLYAKNMYVDQATAVVKNPALSAFIKLYHAINPTADTKELADTLKANKEVFADPVLSTFISPSNVNTIHEHPEITAKDVKGLISSRINQEIALNARLITTVCMLNAPDGRPVESYEVLHSSGGIFLPTFTDLGELQRAKDVPHGTNVRIVSTTFDEFYKITSGNVAMVVNYGDERIELPPELIKKMATTKEKRSQKIQNGETAKTIISDIPNPPAELLKLANIIATNVQEVRAIWAKIKDDTDIDYKESKKSYLLIIEHDGEFSDITELLDSILTPLATDNLSFETASYLDDLGHQYAKGEPIYANDRSRLARIGQVVEEYKNVTAKECYSIKLVNERPSILDDKFGGQPYLPISEPYPTDKNGVPLPLLFQINIENIDLSDWPKSGVLEIFMDMAGGYPCKYAVRLFPSGREHQTNFPEINTRERVMAIGYKIATEKAISYMSTSDFRFEDVITKVFESVYGNGFSNTQDITDFLGGSETWLDSLNELTCSNPSIMLGGYQDFAQNDPREEDAELATKTESLLKLESADGYEIPEIGDAGVLFTFISPDDLRNGKFENAVVDCDSC